MEEMEEMENVEERRKLNKVNSKTQNKVETNSSLNIKDKWLDRVWTLAIPFYKHIHNNIHWLTAHSMF